MLANMTRVTRLGTVDAQSLVEEELAAQCDLRRRHWIVRRNRHRFVTGELRRQRLSLRPKAAAGRFSDVGFASCEKKNRDQDQSAGSHSARILPSRFAKSLERFVCCETTCDSLRN